MSGRTIPAEEIDRHLDAVLRASGSALRFYTLPKTIERMRDAIEAVMLAGRLVTPPDPQETRMSEIVDLNAERNKRERPDQEHIAHDSEGREMYRFGLEFKHDGSTWSVHIFAYDFEDAERRAASMRESLTVYGQIFCEVPA